MYGIYGCLHTYVCTRGQWLIRGTIDNKTFNSLFHRLPFQQSTPANSQDYSLYPAFFLSLSPQVCCLGARLTFAPIQLINKVTSLALKQQQWFRCKNINSLQGATMVIHPSLILLAQGSASAHLQLRHRQRIQPFIYTTHSLTHT